MKIWFHDREIEMYATYSILFFLDVLRLLFFIIGLSLAFNF